MSKHLSKIQMQRFGYLKDKTRSLTQYVEGIQQRLTVTPSKHKHRADAYRLYLEKELKCAQKTINNLDHEMRTIGTF